MSLKSFSNAREVGFVFTISYTYFKLYIKITINKKYFGD
jgi:hypothetical protein